MPFGTFMDGRNPVQLRGLEWLSLSDEGHHVTQVSTDDQGGGVTQVWTSQAGTIPCRIDPVGSRTSRVTGGAIDERSTHVVTVPAGTALGGTVSAGNRFAIDGRGTFEITVTRDRTAEWSREFEVVAL
jgi:hypothetical protein